MSRSFLDRRHENPDVEIEAWITGVAHGKDGMNWNVYVNGESDCDTAAQILETAALVLRMEGEEEYVMATKMKDQIKSMYKQYPKAVFVLVMLGWGLGLVTAGIGSVLGGG